MLVHGNTSSSVFYLPLMERLSDFFEMAAPDLRCFGDSDAKTVDAARGLRDFSDDLNEFSEAIGWDKFYLLGWSMGGGVAMQYAVDHSERLLGLILQNPVSPFGFGGTYGPDGKTLLPVGLASGGGCANPSLVQALDTGDRDYCRQTMNSLYFTPPFRADPAWEERFIDGMLSSTVGEGMYPGDYAATGAWPGVVSGTVGIFNTMSPANCNLSGLADIPNRIPVLWIRGGSDLIVSDCSMAEFGGLGKMGFVPGWPGEDQFPPQPMLEQTRYVLRQYEANGGAYREVVIPGGGHGCMLDHEDEFAAALMEFMQA